MAFNVTVDKETCIGCGACTNVCDNFEIGEEKVAGAMKQVAHAKKSKVPEAGCNKDAEDICPVTAIKVTEA